MAYKYCTIKSELSGLVLDVDGADVSPGARVIPWEHHGNVNQIWYEDPVTGTIRSKLNNFCLDIDGEQLVLNPFKPGDPNQQWEHHERHIRNRLQHNNVLDVYASNKSPGAKIGPYELHGGSNQCWNFEYTGEQASYPSQHFYIVSEMNAKVVDLQAACPDEGTKVVVWSKDYEQIKNQLWYFDPTGCIHSSMNDFVFSNTDIGKKLKMKPFSDDPRCQWRQDGAKIVNGNGECLDILDRKDENGAKVCSHKYKEYPSQHWRLEFV